MENRSDLERALFSIRGHRPVNPSIDKDDEIAIVVRLKKMDWVRTVSLLFVCFFFARVPRGGVFRVARLVQRDGPALRRRRRRRGVVRVRGRHGHDGRPQRQRGARPARRPLRQAAPALRRPVDPHQRALLSVGSDGARKMLLIEACGSILFFEPKSWLSSKFPAPHWTLMGH